MPKIKSHAVQPVTKIYSLRTKTGASFAYQIGVKKLKSGAKIVTINGTESDSYSPDIQAHALLRAEQEGLI